MFNQKITENVYLYSQSFGKRGIGGQGAVFVLCLIIAVCCLAINPILAGVIFLFGGVVLMVGNKSDDKMWGKQRRLTQELATELNNWLIPLIKENIDKPVEINFFEKYQDVFIQYKCEDINHFLNKYYYPQIGSRIVYINAIPPYGNSVITLFYEYAPGKVGTGFQIDIDGKTHNIDSINNYKQRHDNVEFAKLVQEIYDVKKQQEKLILNNTNANANKTLNKIKPILEQNTEKLLKAKQIFKELQNTESMSYFTFQGRFDNKETEEVLNRIFNMYV